MKWIWITGMAAMMLAGICISSPSVAHERKDGVREDRVATTQNGKDDTRAAKTATALNSATYKAEEALSELNEEEAESGERMMEFIFEGEKVPISTEAGFYQSLASIVRDIAYYYNET